MRRTELLVLLFVLVVAVGFRFVRLGSTPPGLYPDEAMNGNNAIQAWETGSFQLFYPENNGREGLFINLQAVAVRVLGNTPVALRSASALIGVLTVLGTYLLTRRLFDDWRLAAIAAFLMATGFWHVNFSRIGFRAILSPFMAVWGFYYLYKGIETHRLWHWGMAGLFFGLGVHTYIAFRLMPLAILLVLAAYGWTLRAAFSHDKYAFARGRMLGGVAALVGILFIVVLPLAVYFVAHPEDLSGRVNQLSVFASERPWRDLMRNIVLTLGMFFTEGDHNWRHNLSGEPVLFWPVAALFAVGLAHTLWRVGHSLGGRGHPGVVHVLLLSWFAVGLMPGVIANEGVPHALRTLTAAPAVYIMAALGLHWLYTWLYRWYSLRDRHRGEGATIVGLAVVALLFAFAVADGSRYFIRWAGSPATAGAFNEPYVRIAEHLNALPQKTPKYVIVNAGGVLVNEIPMPAQTIMFLTDTWTPEKQKAKNLRYLTPQQWGRTRIPHGSFVISLEP